MNNHFMKFAMKIFNMLGLTFLGVVIIYSKPSSKNKKIENIIQEISANRIKSTIQKLVSFGTRHTLSDTNSSTQGIGAARRWIKSEFEQYAESSNGKMKVAFHETMVPSSRRVPYPVNVVNVIATLSPADTSKPSSKRIIIVSGHYDSRATDVMDSTSLAPGANDDGSGTALVLELARVLSRYKFDATIMFVCFAGEEQGLLGASALAETAKKNGWHIEAVLNNDIVGNIYGGGGEVESTYVRLFSEAYSPLDTGSVFGQRNSLGLENDGVSRSLARYCKEEGEKYVKNFGVEMIYRRDRFLRGGDHAPFHQKGFAAVRFTEVKENFDHQHQTVRRDSGRLYGDLPEFMNYRYCSNVARVNAAVIASLASAPAPPTDTRVLTTGLGYSSSFRWNKNSEPDIAGYYLRYRKTSSPTWEGNIFTADTSITVKFSKDDYLFGVQAVDKEGNASLITIPYPLR